ncbi:metal ABC transporter solute-binding protein, Zn/Mn family [Coprobacter tertius]|uniref:Zinc ABC transporter substrate-binding protein n=1 Tax=Coprobacter tertius TaxID=2944915 RepID=A0ABT1MG77_9BACT|nr:zinc ABC transporter substrate-binding protein [Coprobacter tertius]MCP9611637.1 zinc ABC transporter substrate-binding protein [Coprobacter tertius]
MRLYCGFVAVVLGISIFLLSCVGDSDNKKIITVTIQPQKYFAEKIAGDKFEINCIVPNGSNPEAYDPSPSNLVHVGKSVAYFKIGNIGFEMAWLGKLAQNNPAMKIYDNAEGIEILTGTHQHEGHVEHQQHEIEVDPHYWSSPKQAQVIARNMYKAFVELDPENKDFYRKNYDNLTSEIVRMDTFMTQKLAPVEGSAFIIYHPSLSYLAHDYGLKQMSIELNGKSPSARYMKQIVDTARENNVKVIFIQKEFDVKQAQTLAKELGCRIAQINPLNYNWNEELEHITNELSR